MPTGGLIDDPIRFEPTDAVSGRSLQRHACCRLGALAIRNRFDTREAGLIPTEATITIPHLLQQVRPVDYGTSSVTTLNCRSKFLPKLVEMATSAASRPRAIRIRPIRGAL